jgi:DNA polymerase III sliding clamp (beta) subunit (PCNA family)
MADEKQNKAVTVRASSLKECSTIISKLHTPDSVASIANIGIRKVGNSLVFSFCGSACSGNTSAEIVGSTSEDFSCIISSKIFSDVLSVISDSPDETAKISLVKGGRALAISSLGRKFEVKCLDDVLNIFPAIYEASEDSVQIPASLFPAVDFVFNASSANGVHSISRCLYMDKGPSGKLYILCTDMKKMFAVQVDSVMEKLSGSVMNAKAVKNIMSIASKFENPKMHDEGNCVVFSFGNSVIKSAKMEVNKMPIARLMGMADKLDRHMTMNAATLKSAMSDISKTIDGEYVTLAMSDKMTMTCVSEDAESCVEIPATESSCSEEVKISFVATNILPCFSKFPCETVKLTYLNQTLPVFLSSVDSDGHEVVAIVSAIVSN